MKKIFRSISAVVLAVAVMLTAVVFDVPEKITAEAATTENCSGNHSGWTEWTNSSPTTPVSLTSGSYYLKEDVTISTMKNNNVVTIPTGTNVTLCLNGHNIIATGSDIRFFWVNGGSLTLCDCKRTGKLTGGSSGSSFGGAVLVSGSSGSFTMNGGIITGNTANTGGGVQVNSGTFIMNGGTISSNTATSNGGGVCVNNGTFTIDGKVDISGNKKDDNSANNVYLASGKTITIGSNFIDASNIGVNTATTPTCKATVSVTGSSAKDISTSFTADKDGQSIVYSGGSVQLLGAHNTTKTEKKDATCIANGNIEYWKCSTCSKYFSDSACTNEITQDQTVKEKTGHTWGEWQTTTAATCTAEGKKERFCITSGCTEKETETIDKIDHVYEDGKCKNCNAVDPAHTHTGGTATCEKKAVCDICEQEYGELGEHIYGAWSITKYPSTTATGTAERACSCGEKQTKTDVPVLTDTSVWTKDDTQHVDPTEDGAGKDVYMSVYGTVTVTIPQLGHTHTLTHVDEIPATETTEGVKEHWYCSGCKKDFTDENGTTEISDLTIPVIGHTHTLTHISATETTKEHWHCDCGKDFLDENGEHEATADDLKTGMIEKEVQSGDNAPAATLTTPADELINAVLTEEDKELVIEGKDIKIILTIDDAANKVSNADKAAVEAAIGNESGFILGQCLDVNLLKIIDGRQEKIAQTSTPLTITFEIPVGLRGSGRTFSVIRVHDGETTILEDKDENPDTVTIETDKFSTYALAYSENTNVTPPGGGSSGGNAPAPSVSKPTNSGDTSSESRGSSDNGTVTSSSGETSSTDENNFMPSESMPTDNNENPATGITMSLVPLAAAVIVLTVTIKRKRNK